MAQKLIIVCDDAGFASVDRGILAFVERTQVPVCAEYLIEQPGASERAKVMFKQPLVSIGLHFELSDIGDAERVKMSADLRAARSCLGEQAEIQEKAMKQAKQQLSFFRDTLGADPAHISTHGDFNIDSGGHVMPWWTDLMAELFSGDVPPMQLASPHVRHNLYSWNLIETAHAPRTPDEFGEELAAVRENNIVEFVIHPALPEKGDASLDMLFTADMRRADLEAAVAIVQSGVIEQSGFEIVPVAALRS